MFRNLENLEEQEENICKCLNVWKEVTFPSPSCCSAFLSRRLLNEHSAQRLTGQHCLLSICTYLSRSAQIWDEHSAQRQLWINLLLFLVVLEQELLRHGGLCAGNHVTLSSCHPVILTHVVLSSYHVVLRAGDLRGDQPWEKPCSVAEWERLQVGEFIFF